MKILLLGSTGSIGTSTVNCVERFPERFTLAGLAANNNVELLLQQAKRFSPAAVCLGTEAGAQTARAQLPSSVRVYSGEEGLEQIVNETDFDVLLNALVGAVGLRPTVAALKRNKRVALANKESLVIGGDLITSLLAQGHGELLPVDSEHSAILQCLNEEDRGAIESLILTASGGPFRELAAERFASITPEQALKHPTWNMGKKITIDSATLMNKGFEVIEAHHIFRTPYDRLQIVIHPQSIIHSMVVFHDGAVLAQAGVPDMELPIQYALSYPTRLPLQSERLNLVSVGALTFFEPDFKRFPCLRLCLEAGASGGTLPVALNAANEIAVNAFLERRIGFTQIAESIAEVLSHHQPQKADSLEVILEADRSAREATHTLIAKRNS